MTSSKFNPQSISRFQKERFLKILSEDDFRDTVLRPLLYKQGFADGRDLCGPTEEGKDCLFTIESPLSGIEIYVVQTKRGDLNLASKASKNLINATAQLRTALETTVVLLEGKRKVKPNHVLLCTSGKINANARKHVADEITDPRIKFLDSDDLIPLVDEKLPEIWLGIDATRYPYLSELRASLTAEPEKGIRPSMFLCPATSDRFAPLKVHRVEARRRRTKGFRPRPKFDELPVTGLSERKERRVLLLGEAGAGKTASVRRLAAVMAETAIAAHGDAVIPILLRASELLGPEGLTSKLATHTESISSARKPAFSSSELDAGNVTLLVDGLDEVATSEERGKVLEQLAEFGDSWPNCQIVLASRRYPWIRNLPKIESFSEFRLSPIDWKETTAIVKRLQKGQALSEPKAREVLRRLQDVHGMALNPLLVTVFVASSDYSRHDIPANITELFKKFTELMLGRWDEHKGLNEQYHAPLKDFLLRQLALDMHRRRCNSIPLDDAESFFSRLLDQRGQAAAAPALFEEVFHRSGLIRILGDRVEFAHHLLQEFFAGRAMTTTEVQEHLTDDWWQRPVVFFFGEQPDRQSLLEAAVSQLTQCAGNELAQATTTVGLSLQACYLLTLDSKVSLFSRVLFQLSRVSIEFFGPDGPPTGRPLLDFISNYVVGRDSVSCDVIRLRKDQVEVEAMHLAKADSSLAVEHIEYWQIIAELECGCLASAYERARTFKPTDPRMLLTIHLGAFMYEHLRAGTKEERRAARKMQSLLAPKIEHLRSQVLDEFDSELLEWQQGEVRSISIQGG